MSANYWTGQMLGGRYQIQELLGQGGMSAVYKAVDTNLKRVVAIKIIHPHLSTDPAFVNRFEDEAQAVARLRHPNIVHVYDFSHVDNVYYMVQEFIAGETLQARLHSLSQASQHMPLARAIKYMIDICRAVGYAHQNGMIHRDIKPANIMLDEHDKAVLMDFGIVKLLGGTRHTATGAVIGTAAYMAPDTIRGDPPDARSDIYSLGITLYEMVSGRVPFDAESVMTLMMKHLNEPVPDLTQWRPGAPQELKAIIEKALAKQREHRFSSTQEMAKALEKVLFRLESGAPIEAADNAVIASIPVQIAPTQNFPVSLPGDAPAAKAEPFPAIRVSSSPSAPAPRAGIRPLHLIGGATALLLVMIVCITAASFVLPRLLPERASAAPGSVAQWTDTPVQALPDTPLPSSTAAPAASATPFTEMIVASSPTAALPTASPTPAFAPTATIPPGIPFVRINKIEVDAQNRYVVEYETSEYTEQLPGVHIHFFFNTVSPAQAGTPGKGPWILYGGPRPFTGYNTSDRPAEASQLCALVANANHSVQPDSGACYPLPDVPTITTRSEVACLTGPGDAYPGAALVKQGATVLLKGLSIDELWLYVQNPDQLDAACWLPTVSTFIQGDVSQLPLVEPPPMPTPNTLVVEITSITLDSSGRFVVEFTAHNFTAAIPGIHIHFYFNTVSPAQVGIGGGGARKMYAGKSPFTTFNALEKPDGATQMCAIVANPDHSVIPDSGNCFSLPEVPPAILDMLRNVTPTVEATPRY